MMLSGNRTIQATHFAGKFSSWDRDSVVPSRGRCHACGISPLRCCVTSNRSRPMSPQGS
jgi:hypothetical protein